MLSILKQVIQTKNKWGLKPLLIGSVYELGFLIKHHRFKYFFVVEPEDMDISSEDSKHSDPYVPAPYYILSIALNQITKVISDPKNSIFIDIGCGPGRALYCSTTVGFNRLIGIEQSKTLTDLCNQNLKRYLSPQVQTEIINRNVKDIDVLKLINDFEGDNKTDSLVFFLYTPFNDEMLRILLNKFDELDYLDCYIIFFGPQNKSTMKQKNFSIVYTHEINPDTPINIYFRGKSLD